MESHGFKIEGTGGGEAYVRQHGKAIEVVTDAGESLLPDRRQDNVDVGYYPDAALLGQSMDEEAAEAAGIVFVGDFYTFKEVLDALQYPADQPVLL